MAAAPPPHVVVFPWPEQGHINPATAIADFLVESGVRVTLVLTQSSHGSAHRASLQDSSPLLRVEVVPDVPPSFWLHPAATEEALDRLLSDTAHRPSCLLIDAFFPWSHSLAARHRLPRVEIWTASASAFTIGLYVPELLARGCLPVPKPEAGSEKVIDFIPGLTPFRTVDLPMMFTVPDIDGAWFKFWVSVVQQSRNADRVLAHTVFDIEHEVVDALRENCAIQMDPIGPLISETRLSLRAEDSSIISWLDNQAENSVLYISFGSVWCLKDDEVIELAHGLAASEQPYLWVRRVDDNATGKQSNQKVEEAIELLKRTGRGCLTSWAPQLTVLTHRAVGGFLSHCGWNSTFESLHLGVPILCLAMGGEQPMNVKYIVNDWEAGLALQEAENRHKPLQRENVERMIRAMLTGEEGKRAREGALKWSKLSHNAYHGSSKKNLQEFVDDVKNGKLKISTCS